MLKIAINIYNESRESWSFPKNIYFDGVYSNGRLDSIDCVESIYYVYRGQKFTVYLKDILGADLPNFNDVFRNTVLGGEVSKDIVNTIKEFIDYSDYQLHKFTKVGGRIGISIIGGNQGKKITLYDLPWQEDGTEQNDQKKEEITKFWTNKKVLSEPSSCKQPEENFRWDDDNHDNDDAPLLGCDDFNSPFMILAY